MDAPRRLDQLGWTWLQVMVAALEQESGIGLFREGEHNARTCADVVSPSHLRLTP